jgi:primase-polymerase (primpol)-like protein
MKADARPDHLPNALAPLFALRNWAITRWVPTKGGKRTKVPYRSARPNTKGSSTDPMTWSDFDTAVAAPKCADGIGFCLLNSGFGALDIDNCRDAATGAIDPWAEELVARTGSYADVLPRSPAVPANLDAIMEALRRIRS